MTSYRSHLLFLSSPPWRRLTEPVVEALHSSSVELDYVSDFLDLLEVFFHLIDFHEDAAHTLDLCVGTSDQITSSVVGCLDGALHLFVELGSR